MWNVTAGIYEHKGHLLMNVTAYWQNAEDDNWSARFEQRMKIPIPASMVVMSEPDEMADSMLCALMMAWEQEDECTHVKRETCALQSQKTWHHAGESQQVIPH